MRAAVKAPCATCGHSKRSHDSMDAGGCRIGWTYLSPEKACQCVEYVARPAKDAELTRGGAE